MREVQLDLVLRGQGDGEGSGAPGAASRLLTVRDLALFFGVHEKTVYLWAARGSLPCIRIGNRLRFSAADVTRWVEARKDGV